MDSSQKYQIVKDGYSQYARQDQSTAYSQKVATAFGYSLEDLSSIPEGANLGLSCGNPLGTAKLQKVRDPIMPPAGEVVVDLGSGGGFDVFQAAKKVAPNGKAIGIDMNKDMLALARKNAAKSDITNVSFVESGITSISLPSESANCVVSNCVINLVPEADKHLVFEEIFRILMPAGRVAISDILAKKELPTEIRDDVSLYVGCIAGASRVGQYEQYLKDAGFNGKRWFTFRVRSASGLSSLDIMIVETHSDLNVYKDGALMDSGKTGPASCCNPKGTVVTNGSKPSADYDLNEWVASYQIYAVKN
ncbi:MAG: hypothetical protein M1836_001328 [Candelina mexicana]|nr:MAG: hypothetical protein M1836_001328 [Candelina mexicana]